MVNAHTDNKIKSNAKERINLDFKMIFTAYFISAIKIAS